MSKLCTMFKVSDDTIVRVMKRNKIPMRVTVGFNGNKNSNWKGGYSLRYAKNLAIRHIGKNACVYCGYTTLTDVHHWDGNNKNNKPENLVLLCPNHHREVHVGLLAKEKILNRPRRGGEVPRESHKLQTPVQFRAALRKAA